MPLDKARIQGFGSDGPATEKIPECLEGHELQLWAARSGKCDGCHKKVQTGEQVMDCRRCNWYLCNICCPQSKAQESSLWGAISSLPFYVLDDMSEMATDIETFVSASVFDQEKDLENQGKAAQSHEPPVSPRQKAESIQVVSEFCEKYPAVRVVPNEVDLDVFWAKCSVLHPKPIADAIYDQLSFSGGDNEWQPRLRALYALEHLHHKGGMGKDVTRIVMHSAKGLLQHLVEVEKCSAKAQQVIATLRGAKPGEGSVTEKSPADAAVGTGAREASQAKSPASSNAPSASSTIAKPKAAADLLDIAAPPVVPQPKQASQASQDLLSIPLSEPAGQAAAARSQGASDLLDLTIATAPAPAPLAAAPPASSAAPASAPSAALAASPAAHLADLYALYPQSSSMPSAPAPFKDTSAFNLLPPPTAPGLFGSAAAVAPSRPAPQAGATSVGTRSSSAEQQDGPAPKEKGLESLMSDAVAGLGNLGTSPAASQPSRQPTGVHRALAAH